MRAPLHDEGLNLHAPRSKPAFSQPFVNPTTGFVSLCGVTRTHIPLVKATPAMDTSNVTEERGALPSDIGGERPLASTPIEGVGITKNYREASGWKSPPSPKTEFEPATRDKTKRYKALTSPNHGARGDKHAPPRERYH